MRYRGVGFHVTPLDSDAYADWVERIRKRTAEGKQPRLYEMRFLLAEYDRLVEQIAHGKELGMTEAVVRQGFWTDPEWLNRNKECPNRDCQGTGFLRNVPGPNELPCPDCRPIAARSHTATCACHLCLGTVAREGGTASD